jgi:large subunit ribosomal protein L10
MPTKEKEIALADIKKTFTGASSVMVSHFSRLTNEEITELRSKLRKTKAVHKVVKNTLAIRAARELNFEPLVKFLEGPTVLTIAHGDISAPAKVLMDFAKDHENLKVRGGIVEGKEASVEDLKAIANLPSREVLLGMLAGQLNAPITGLVRVLNGPITGFVRALNGVAEKKAA